MLNVFFSYPQRSSVKLDAGNRKKTEIELLRSQTDKRNVLQKAKLQENFSRKRSQGRQRMRRWDSIGKGLHTLQIRFGDKRWMVICIEPRVLKQHGII